MTSFPRKRESILLCAFSKAKIKLDARFRGHDGKVWRPTDARIITQRHTGGMRRFARQLVRIF
jgi:hypothetical protein